MCKYSINKEILDAVECCDRNRICSEGKLSSVCVPLLLVGDDLLEINQINPRNCACKIDFGGTCYCSCPVRVEIFKKYGD